MTKATRMNCIWIDDRSQRKSTAEAFRRDTGVSLSFVNALGEDINDVLKTVVSDAQPDIVIVDHVLDKTAPARTISKGSTVAEALREDWPTCPIVGITAATKRHDVHARQRQVYDELLSGDSFSDHFNHLVSLAEGFRRIAQMRSASKDALLALLSPPDEDMPRLEQVMPLDFVSGTKTQPEPTLATRLHAWMRDVLFPRPGFLYDRLWTATLLGLNEEGFGKVEKIFRKARYEGIFACDMRERWWASKVKEILSKKCPSEQPSLPWESGRRLPGIKKNHFSRCYSSKKDSPAPETVAYLDEAPSSAQKPMRLRFTVRHPRFPVLPFFEEIRMMAEGR